MAMKFFLLIFVFLFNAVLLRGQKENSHPIRAEFSLESTYSLNKIISGQYSFKKHGRGIHIKLKYDFSPNMGAIASYSVGYYRSKETSTTELGFYKSYEKLKSLLYLAGAYYHVPVTKQIYFETGLTGGFAKLQHREYSMFLITIPIPHQSRHISESFAINFYTGFYYQIKPRFSIDLNFNYYFINLKFQNVNNEDGDGIILDYPAALNVLSALVGLEYRF